MHFSLFCAAFYTDEFITLYGMPLEINSSVWKGMKENQECTSGDYSLENLNGLFLALWLLYPCLVKDMMWGSFNEEWNGRVKLPFYYYYLPNSVFECFFFHDLTWSKGAHAVHEPNVDRGGVSLDVIIDVSRAQGEQGWTSTAEQQLSHHEDEDGKGWGLCGLLNAVVLAVVLVVVRSQGRRD